MNEAAATDEKGKAADIKTSAYYNLFNSNPVATFVLDPKTLKVIDANKMAVRQYQFTREEFTQMSWPDLFSPEDRPQYMERRASDTLYVPQEKVCRQMRKNATLFSLEISECQLEVSDKNILNEPLSVIKKLLNKILTEDILLEMNLCEEALGVAADIGQLDQVIINILTNSREAMPRGGVLSIATARCTLNTATAPYSSEIPTPEDYARLTISDTGTGMAAAIKEKIFNPFFTTREPPGGTGFRL